MTPGEAIGTLLLLAGIFGFVWMFLPKTKPAARRERPTMNTRGRKP